MGMVTRRPRYKRPGWPWLVLGAAVTMVLVLVVATTAKFGAIRIDPTEDTFAVSLRNDTETPVLLKQCDVKCNEFHEQHFLTAGATVGVNTTSADTPNWWVVQDASGQVLGCLNLQYNHKVVGAVVNVSATEPCPK